MSLASEGPHGTLEIKADTDFTKAIEGFKKARGIHFVLAFSGGADDSSPIMEQIKADLGAKDFAPETKAQINEVIKKAADEYVARIVRDVLTPMRGHRIAILTGGTHWGVPNVATRVAKNEFKFPTIGVFPLDAVEKHVLPPDLLDLGVCVHPFAYKSQWGDESPVFTKILDSVVVIGGGAGTMVEVAHILKLNERKGIPMKHIVPILGTGGTADKLPFFPGKPSIMARCVPSYPIKSGTEAFEYLRDNDVITDDIYENPRPT